MDKKTCGIGILSLTAVVLMVAQFIPIGPADAQAGLTIKDRDYSLVTARRGAGGEVVYVTDNRTGMMAAVVWDRGNLTVRAVRAVTDAFAPGAGAVPGR
jgi:hypothetical protein